MRGPRWRRAPHRADRTIPGVARTIPTFVRAAVDAAGDRTWLCTAAGELTYAQAQARVERAASALRAVGVRAGDRVLVTPRNTADYLLSWFALMEVGAVQVPCNPKSSVGELAGFLHQVRPALVLTDEQLAPAVDAATADAGAAVTRVDVGALYDAAPDGRGPVPLDETDVVPTISAAGDAPATADDAALVW